MMMMMMMRAAMALWLGKMVPRLMWFSVQGADQDNVKPSGRSGKNDGCLYLFQFTVQMEIQKGTSRLLQMIRVSIPAKWIAAVRVLPTGVCNRFVNLCGVPLHVFFKFESSSKQFSSKNSESVLLKLCVKESDPQQTTMTMSFSLEGGEVSMRSE